jgi:hypothetical protein
MAGQEAELSRLVKEIILEHCPKARQHEAAVDQFVRKLLAQKVDALEPRPFLKQEAGKPDRSTLERYVIVQFMTSPEYIALQDQ